MVKVIGFEDKATFIIDEKAISGENVKVCVVIEDNCFKIIEFTKGIAGYGYWEEEVFKSDSIDEIKHFIKENYIPVENVREEFERYLEEL